MYIFEKNEDELSFSFETDIGLRYKIEFSNEIPFFEQKNLLYRNVYALDISLLATNVKNFPPKDERIAETVAQIIKRFLQEKMNTIIYTCDTSDGRGYSRYRIFNSWFGKFNESKYIKIDFSINLSKTILHTSLIFKIDNPLRTEIFETFNEIALNLSK